MFSTILQKISAAITNPIDYMLAIQYIWIAFIVSAGIIAGKILGEIAPDEMTSGKKIFIILQKLCYILSLTAFAFAVTSIPAMVIIAILVILFVYKINTWKLDNNNHYLIYTLYGILLGLTPLTTIVYPAVACFLMGLPTGSLMYKTSWRTIIKIVLVTLFGVMLTLLGRVLI